LGGSGPAGNASSHRLTRYPKRPPPAQSASVARVMRANKKTNTKPELRLRRALHAGGFRFLVNRQLQCGSVRVSVDLLFRRSRVAVFVDGCFWHGCPDHGSSPVTNGAYWAAKIDANRRRDQRVNVDLVAAGWTPILIWDHEPIAEAVDRVRDVIRKCDGQG
jgi:DNA mismatch endonuclease, patch repair protein